MDAPFISLSTSGSHDPQAACPVLTDTSDTIETSAIVNLQPTFLSQISTSIHNHVKYHTKDMHLFAEALEGAINQTLPKRGPTRYNNVKGLLLRWEEDDLGVEWELSDLSKVFSEYGFDTEIWFIPTRSAHRQLNNKISSLIENFENENTLFIVYYGGHGFINNARQLTWSCKRDSKYSTLNWSACQSLLEFSESDVLLLLDCCAAAAATCSPIPSNSIVEIIAACGWEQWAPEPGRFSFTNALIEVLQDWLEKRPVFSAAQLSREVTEVLKHPKPKRNIENSRTPAYLVSSSNPKTPSIEIRRRVCQQGSSNPTTGCGALGERSTPESLLSNTSEQQPYSSLLEDDKLIPHLMFVVGLVKDQLLDSGAFSHWLNQFPASVKHILVEGLHHSCPSPIQIPFEPADRLSMARDLALKFARPGPSETNPRGIKRPASPSPRYQDVKVLLLRWEEDPMGVKFDMDELTKVLESSYGFSTDTWLIPTVGSLKALMMKVVKLLEEFGKEDRLLIVYYSGYGLMNESRQAIWSCTSDPLYGSFPWHAIQALLEQSACDILVLLDSCAAATSSIPTSQYSGAIECIAACGFESWTPTPGPDSFRRTLVDVLQDWAGRPSFSTTMLYCEIMNRLRQERPERKGLGKGIERWRTPVHIVTTNNPAARSIEFSPHRTRKRLRMS